MGTVPSAKERGKSITPLSFLKPNCSLGSCVQKCRGAYLRVTPGARPLKSINRPAPSVIDAPRYHEKGHLSITTDKRSDSICSCNSFQLYFKSNGRTKTIFSTT
ncbi:hypothetical protein CEXT_616041 [Caerostris extrusa]|uniref:Uncharacterized protein n=1 Tax=Caerostris extrusa TaxID=172846 RepID=A0AAV4SJM7_CAEEX|nr:hypothetical protein CEXT_616041 [Caerostris extrusa]